MAPVVLALGLGGISSLRDPSPLGAVPALKALG
jgi:hypothetical protein